jgi:hypothetical protein
VDDANQIEVPPSFLALFSTPDGLRLSQPMAEVRQRYELCEDLAQMLCEQASAAAFKSGGSESDVLSAMQGALSAEGGPLREREPAWVVTRVAELLGWALPQAE